MDEDYQLALLLQKEFNDEAPEIIPDAPRKGKENRGISSKSTHSLIDPQWEFIDPTPDIRVLFLQFNDRFFWGKLHGAEVKWSPRMTSCAGVCVYQGRSGFCSVRLSLPLLKLRPRKDLVETLLHEMIHAFLFVTKNNRDRDGHGPEFHKHMERINQEAGTHITVYHTFHDEVRLYQQHWWRCNGPCQHRPPFFGTVRRSTNRAPGPYDRWWAQHEAMCGGKYIKIKEPEDYKKKKADTKQKETGQINGAKGDIRSFFPGALSKPIGNFGKPTNVPVNEIASANKFNGPVNSDVGGSKKSSGVPNSSGKPFLKPVINNVHGFGSGKTAELMAKPTVNPAVNNVVGFGDLVGQGKPKPSTCQPSGVGNVLGGNRKPPFQNGGGGYGGMLNKGSGTLVVSGSKTRASEATSSSGSSKISNSNQSGRVQVFSGTGHVLGKGTSNQAGASSSQQGQQSGRLNPFQKNIPVFTNKEEDAQRKRKSLDNPNSQDTNTSNSSLVTCPVCNQHILASVINSHLDDCISGSPNSAAPPKFSKIENNSEDVIVLSDSEDTHVAEDHGFTNSESYVDCPSCSKKLKKSGFESHLSVCLSSSFEDDDVVEIVSDNFSTQAKCPICGNSFPARDMDKHLENCANCSIQDLSGVFDEDFSDDEEDAAVGSPSKHISDSGEPLFPCPCCLLLIETSKMNYHLDQCVV